MDIKTEWNEKGEKYAAAVNKMVAFGEEFGWDKWTGDEPLDERSHLADEILERLRAANKNGTVAAFRADFPPAHLPFADKLDEKGQSVGDLCFIDADRIVFLTGTPYQSRKAFMLEGDVPQALDENIVSIGKSPQGNCFAVATAEGITTRDGWEGAEIARFNYPAVEDLAITALIPYNDGRRILLVSAEGIYHLSANGAALIHPVRDETDEEWTPSIDMEHGALSPDNKFICVGDQGSNHRILDNSLAPGGAVYPESSYPHFALFSKDGAQVIMNSCHFYNGATLAIAPPEAGDAKDSEEKTSLIDEECRVYAGVSATDYYILGDAYGYIRAFDKKGKKLWRQYLGSTISGMAISDDERTLFVGSYSGIIHKIKLDQGLRDAQTIGNADHFEEFRMLFWKGEEGPLKW